MLRPSPQKAGDQEVIAQPTIRIALALLQEALLFSREANLEPWCFAVELKSLHEAGSSLNALRWLLHRGYVEARLETTRPGADRRSFQALKGTTLQGSVSFVLTDSGALLVPGHRNGSEDAPPVIVEGDLCCGPDNSPLPVAVPCWDQDKRELWFAGLLVKRFKQPAYAQELILTVFEEEGWPTHIDDPLPAVPEVDPKRHLHTTIANLNRAHRHRLLSFGGNGTGTGVCWKRQQSDGKASVEALRKGDYTI